MAALDSDESMPVPFGVSATTGRPLPPVDAVAIADMASEEVAPTPERALLEGRAAPGAAAFALSSEIEDPNDLAEAGWGVVFARNSDPAIKEALAPLLDRRRQQAKARFKIFDGSAAPGPGESVAKWVTRHGASLDIVEPANGVPFYLLLVGSPEEIAYEFQYVLDIFWGVGRLWFPTAEEYRRYAESAVAYETAATVPTRRQIALFATEHDFDRATQLFAAKVARPLADPASPNGPIGKKAKFALRTFIGDDATDGPANRASLAKILRGQIAGGLPAVLFSGSHGMEFDDEARQREAQGALVCQDWTGYGAIERGHWFEAADLPADANLRGLVHFFFACYSAGYPRFDNYARTAASPRKIASESRFSRLPQAMLAHPAGGALASIGHIDRAWAYSFLSDRNRGQIQGFRDVLARIVAGHRIGYATDQFNVRWSALSTDLSEALADRRDNPDVSDAVLANRWIARDDARNYVILGDPAAALRVDAMPALAE